MTYAEPACATCICLFGYTDLCFTLNRRCDVLWYQSSSHGARSAQSKDRCKTCAADYGHLNPLILISHLPILSPEHCYVSWYEKFRDVARSEDKAEIQGCKDDLCRTSMRHVHHLVWVYRPLLHLEQTLCCSLVSIIQQRCQVRS
jgi:hypothetical protein